MKKSVVSSAILLGGMSAAVAQGAPTEGDRNFICRAAIAEAAF